MISAYSYFNPCSGNSEFHSIEDFFYLSPWKKVATIIVTFVASLGLGICGIAMFRYAVFKLSDKYTEDEIAQFHNQTTFLENSLSRYPKQRLIVENGCCLLIDELVGIYQNENKLENPYTRQPLSQETLSNPRFSSVLKATAEYQARIAAKITPETRRQLALLVKGMLNPDEMYVTGGYLSRAQAAYHHFHRYYLTLSDEERTALNEYRIEGFSGMLPGVSAMRPTTFGFLYQTMEASCAHSVATSFIQMLLQLDPETEFDSSECMTMGWIVFNLKTRNKALRIFRPNTPPVQIGET